MPFLDFASSSSDYAEPVSLIRGLQPLKFLPYSFSQTISTVIVVIIAAVFLEYARSIILWKPRLPCSRNLPVGLSFGDHERVVVKAP